MTAQEEQKRSLLLVSEYSAPGLTYYLPVGEPFPAGQHTDHYEVGRGLGAEGTGNLSNPTLKGHCEPKADLAAALA